MARERLSATWWWLAPTAAFLATLVADAGYVLTRDLAWWRFAQFSLLVGLVSGLLGLMLAGALAAPRDRSAESKLAAASAVLLIASLVNFALALGLRVIGAPASPFAWLALYLTAAASLLFLAAGATAWQSRKLHAERTLRVTMAPDREEARR